jgi:hypothetical protein
MMHNFEKESSIHQNPTTFAYIFSCSGQEMDTIIFSILHISSNFITEQTKIREVNDAREQHNKPEYNHKQKKKKKNPRTT